MEEGPDEQQFPSEEHPPPHMEQEGAEAAQVFCPVESASQRLEQHSESAEQRTPCPKQETHLLVEGEQNEPAQQSEVELHVVWLPDGMQEAQVLVPPLSAHTLHCEPHSAEEEHSVPHE